MTDSKSRKRGRPKKEEVVENSSRVIHIAADAELVEQINLFREHCLDLTGVPVSMSEAMRALLIYALIKHPLMGG